jgi:hypothetical protein
MRTFTNAAFVLAAVVATAFTTPAAATDLPFGRAVLVVPCGDGNRPSQRAVAELIGSNNAHEVYAARNRLMGQVRSACRKAGIIQVAVVGRATDAQVAVEVAAAAPVAGL